MNQPNQPDALTAAKVAGQRAYPAQPQAQRRPPTAWESVPTFVRFAMWVVSILIVVQVVAVVVFGLIFLLVGGLAIGGMAA